MAEYKVVNTTQLDSDLASVANAIRTKGGATESLEFPNGFVNAVNAIELGEQYQVFETYHDSISGYIGISNYGNNIISIETANESYNENGEVVGTLPENVTIKYVEIDYNGNTYRLEDIQELEGREVWVCYHTENTGLQSTVVGGRVVASLYYYDIETYPEFYRAVADDALEYGTPIRIYY